MRPLGATSTVSGPRIFPFARYVAFSSFVLGANLPVNGGDGSSLDKKKKKQSDFQCVRSF